MRNYLPHIGESARKHRNLSRLISLFLSIPPCIPTLRKIARVSVSRGTWDYTRTYLPHQEKMRILSSQKLAYRFINYSIDSLPPAYLCPVSSLYTRTASQTFVEIRSRFPARLVVASATAVAGKSRDSFSSFLFASINLSSFLARDSFFQHADYARARARSWVVIELEFRRASLCSTRGK